MTRAAAARMVAVDLLPHLRRAHDHIDRHFAAPLDLDQLASVAGVSKYHFARSFEAAYGVTPIRYLTRRWTTTRPASSGASWRGRHVPPGALRPALRRRGGHARQHRELAGAGRAPGLHAGRLGHPRRGCRGPVRELIRGRDPGAIRD